MEKRKKIILSGIIVVLVLIFGISYAYFQSTRTQDNNNIGGTGCFTMEFSDENPISLTNAFPISDADGMNTTPYTFTITNTCSMHASYQINLEVLNTSNLGTNFVRVALNNNHRILNTYDEVETTLANADLSYRLGTGTLEPDETVTYSVRKWMDKDTPLLPETQNRRLDTRVVIVYVPYVTPIARNILMGYTFTQNSTALFLDIPNLRRDQVESVEFRNEITVDINSPTVHDVSRDQNNLVVAWLEDGSVAGRYKVIIAADGEVIASSGRSLFQNLTNLTSIDLTYLDTSKVEDMRMMFHGIRNLTNLDLTNFDTSNAIDMNTMFSTTGLSTITFGENFDTSNVTDMNWMFNNIRNLTQIITPEGINVINWDTSRVTNMSNMFSTTGLSTITFGENFDTSNVTDMIRMFANTRNLTNLDLTNFDTSNVTRMTGMFSDTDNPRSPTGLSTITFGENFDTSNVRYMDNMFGGLINLTQIITPEGTNVINWDTSRVIFMTSMFWQTGLSTITFGENFVTDNVTGMLAMFHNARNLTQIITPAGTNVINWDTSRVTNMQNMFNDTSLSTITFGTNFRTDNVTSMHAMFQNMTNLTQITTPAGTNVINWDTSSVTNMQSMFMDTRLTGITFGPNFDTSNVTNMGWMFRDMTNLNNTVGIDMRHFNFSNVTTHINMFMNVPTNVRLTVNPAGDAWIAARFPTYTNRVVIP